MVYLFLFSTPYFSKKIGIEGVQLYSISSPMYAGLVVLCVVSTVMMSPK